METKFFYEGFDFKTQRCEYVNITPAIAREFLEHNTSNRAKKLANINRMVAHMKAGKWTDTSNSISFNKNGEMNDGQNRMIALIEAGVTLTMTVKFGLECDSFKYTDIGMKRTFGDTLTSRGCNNCNNLAGIITRYYHMMRGSFAENHSSTNVYENKPSNDILLNLYEKHKDFFDQLVTKAEQLYSRRRILKVSEIGAIISYLILYKGKSEDMVMTFMSALCGNGVSDRTNAIELLQDRLVRDKTGSVHLLYSVKIQFIAKAWNYFYNRKSIKVLSLDTSKEEVKFL